ncbi:GTP cyclohydrolase I [Penicillium angulare]|uniref:GTP cyclohydrolase 1 n=1 Tax=Penicillium angulare TaxID=116970 RepID=A0A9W9FIV5_9EURO|nr:GTP cyclohydrolase I [Penicillium angulare]
MSLSGPINDSNVGFGHLKWEKGFEEWNEIPRQLGNEQEAQVAATTSMASLSLPTSLTPPTDAQEADLTYSYDPTIMNRIQVQEEAIGSSPTRRDADSIQLESDCKLDRMVSAVTTILECIGENASREGLQKTPERYARAMLYFTKGYEEEIDSVVNGGIFHENHDGLVIVKNIRISSLCEHHLVPFTGTIHAGYVPDGRLLGLSKIARLAEIFSRRLQVQERLTNQIAAVIEQVIEPSGVGVIMEASHLCMVMRGVEKTTSTTVTSCMLGCMRSNAQLRDEFLTLVQSKTF